MVDYLENLANPRVRELESEVVSAVSASRLEFGNTSLVGPVEAPTAGDAAAAAPAAAVATAAATRSEIQLAARSRRLQRWQLVASQSTTVIFIFVFLLCACWQLRAAEHAAWQCAAAATSGAPDDAVRAARRRDHER